MNFTAIDFKIATGHINSACAVGIVTVENSIITDEYYTLIQPSGNYYWYKNIAVHNITSSDTRNSPVFSEIYPEVKKRLSGKIIAAHNEAFDRNVLKSTMNHYSLDYRDLSLPDRCECTCRIYRAKGFRPANLAACCSIMNIELNHLGAA